MLRRMSFWDKLRVFILVGFIGTVFGYLAIDFTWEVIKPFLFIVGIGVLVLFVISGASFGIPVIVVNKKKDDD